jgi:hypothetical protein
MRIRALELLEGGCVLVDFDSGTPLPIPPGWFKGKADAEAFIRWHGQPCDRSEHLRTCARQWARVRDWLECPTCSEGEHGRVEPGQALCATCLCDLPAEAANG